MLPIKEGGRHGSDEELGTVGIRTSILCPLIVSTATGTVKKEEGGRRRFFFGKAYSHRKQPGLIMLEREILICKRLGSVNAC